MGAGEVSVQRQSWCMFTHVCVCVQAEMEMESLLMARKQLLQQWSSSLVGMRRRDEAFSAMQEAVRWEWGQEKADLTINMLLIHFKSVNASQTYM